MFAAAKVLVIVTESDAPVPNSTYTKFHFIHLFQQKNTNRHVSKYYFVFPIFSLRDCWNMSSCFVLGKSSRSQPSYVSLPCMYPIYPCSFGSMPTLTNYYDILYLFHKCLVDSIQFVLRLQKYPNKHLENRNRHNIVVYDCRKYYQLK